MRSLVLGTAGHIDHGKTALVRALTGVDTDRLREEKERGITIDLGFAELAEEGLVLGVVDVPGHEGFVRNMLAGATGMDVVVLVVAADEGIMPQTREHLAIVTLLGVRRLVVALTKCDLVEDAWLELVREEVADLLDGGPWADAPVVATSAATGAGLDDLRAALREVAAAVEDEDEDDLAFLPVDRVFTVTGTGTVVTGTLWSGTLAAGRRVRLLPGDLDARIRGVEVHGRAASASSAGRRTALALAGPGVDRARVRRGHVVVSDDAWRSTHMLTARLRLVPDTAWSLAHNQRVHVHLGTAEVAARCVLLDGEALGPGEEGWGQLRLEAPVVARAREPFVLRSWSPVTTIGGGRVAEPDPPKRKEVDPGTGALLEAVLDGEPAEAVAAAVELAGVEGVEAARLPVLTGLTPGAVRGALDGAGDEGPGPGDTPVERGGRVHTAARVEAARAAVERCVDDWHAREPLRPGAPLEAVRSAPEGATATLVDDILSELVAEGRLRIVDGSAARPTFEPVLGAEERALRDRIAALYRDAGLQPPAVSELPAPVGGHPDLWPLLRILEDRGDLVRLEEGLFVWAETLREAEARMRAELGGRTGLGPADFREVIPVTRKHLIPILGHFDRSGATVRSGDGRAVETG